ncbi:hypothetical protein EG834_18955 [bacterium]|nr:hypothetical protein [bacterium]
MNHPLDKLPNNRRLPIFLLALLMTLIIFGVFRVLDTPLRTFDMPGGIVAFEFAGDIKTATGILGSWDARARLFAAFGLGLDYLFMPFYALALSLGILLAAGRHPGAFEKAGAWLGWGALAAALFDAVENYSLWQLLQGNLQEGWANLAAICATIKFGLLILGLVYALLGWVLPKKK